MITVYYLNASSLDSATAIYVDPLMTVFAPEGFYQQDDITREWVGGVLQPSQLCDSCASPCGDYPIVGGGALGQYITNINAGSGLGAIVITVNPGDVPNGFLVIYNSVAYNKFSSPTYGYLAGTSGLATYIGKSASDCGIVAGSPYTLNQYEYDGSNYISMGSTTVVSVASGQMALTTNGPGDCVMVIPKTVVSPTTIQIITNAPCSSDSFSVEVACPTSMQTYQSTVKYDSSLEACDVFPVYQTYYVVHVNGSGGTLGLYDWVFSDNLGQNVLPNGYYYADVAVPGTDNGYQVQNGVIISFFTC